MASERKVSQAFQSFARRENLPADLTCEDGSSVAREIRERPFFMSRVTDAEILQKFRTGIEGVVSGAKGEDTVAQELEAHRGEQQRQRFDGSSVRHSSEAA